MASAKIILRKKPNKDGTYSLALQIIKDRKNSIFHVGHSIEMKYWDAEKGRIKKTHPNSVRLNNFLSKKLMDAEDKLLELQSLKQDHSHKSIKENIVDKKPRASLH